jgi:hypothetical protein
LVLRRLREDGFTADIAFPGQKFPQISDAVAAVHIEKVDRANLEVTVEISIICPASMGGTACEMKALRATEVLRWSGAVCVQNGCTYDGIAQVYVVSVLATFTGMTEADDCTVWPGFYCYVDNQLHRFAIGFTAVQQTGAAAQYVIGEAVPVGTSLGTSAWEIQLEELIPVGSPEFDSPMEPCVVKILTDQKTEIYSGCRWTTISREFSKQGLRRIRKGVALGSEES